MSDYIDVIHHRHVDKVGKNKAHKSKNSGNFQVKKRTKYVNEVIKYPTKVHVIPNEYGDRFIPRRYFVQPSTLRGATNSIDENDNDILSVKKQPFYWRMHNYRITIGNQLGLVESKKLLNFHDVGAVHSSNRNAFQPSITIEHKIPSKSVEELDWPCKPRAKPLAYNDSTHDMPDFDEYVNGHNIIDWSNKGQIAASFERSLVLWGPPSEADNEISTEMYEFFQVKALKYSPNGQYLAISSNDIIASLLQIWDVSDKKSIERVNEFKFLKETPTDAIRCIEWNKYNDHIICGMLTGAVFIISCPENGDNIILLHRCEEFPIGSSVSNIKYSIHSAYIAITTLAGNLRVLRNNSNFEVSLDNQRAHYIAWHPWNESYLFTGHKSPAAIHLLDLKTKTTIAHYRRTDMQYQLCALSISPLSAEVLASFSHEVDHVTHSDILVMASMNRIVDKLSAHHDAVYYILWDPSGTKVATIGQDESLNIWHFFGRSQKKANELIKIHSHVKVPKDSKLNLGNAFMMLR